jgi:hypothetical protein
VFAIAMLLASLLPAVAVAATAPEAPPPFRPVMLERSGSVLVKSLPASSAAATHRTRPFLRLTPGGAARPQASAIRVTTLPAGPTAPSAVENVLTKFPMISLDQQLAAPFGKDQFVTPPDTQVAAGPSHLVEMVNSSGSVWDKSGTLLTLFDLNVFFAVPPGSSFSDPRILYDRDSQRWFASGVAFVPSTLASVVTIDVSTTSNPLDTWVQYSAAKSSNLHDQPKIGVSADKVVLSWNDFSPVSFLGQSTWVLEKSQMVAGTPANGAAIGPDSTRQSLVPAVQLTSNSDEYIVYNRGASLGLVTITGTPLGANVVWNESDPAAPPTSAPPAADQPGLPGSIATNDDRFLTAVWENGILWTGGNDGCVPGGDTVTRPCSRLIQVFTSTATINQEFDIATTFGGLYYPAFALDGNGNMYVVYNISDSLTQYVGVRITGQLAGAAPQTVAAAQTIRPGDTTYNMNPCFGTTGASRWGDYAGAAIDPQNPTDVWVASEYAATGTTATPTKPSTVGCAWGTFAAQLTFAVTVVPDFTLSATPPSQTVTQGASATYTVTVNPTGGFTGSVGLGVTGLPAGAGGTFNPSSVTTTGSSTLTVTTISTTPPGTYPLTITGTSGTLSHSAAITLVVQAAPDFTLSASPSSRTVTRGGGTNYAVSITPTGGFNGAIALSASGLPSRVSARFSSNNTTLTSSTMSVSTSSRTPRGTYHLTITAASGSLRHSTTVTLVVN